MSLQDADFLGVTPTINLPSDPEDGEVFTAPENTYLGGSIIIGIYRNKQLVGTAQRIEPVPMVSKKYLLTRFSSSRLLKKGDLLNVKVIQMQYTHLVFHNGYGWQGHKTKDEGLLLQENYYRVDSASIVGPYTTNYRLYEYVCLELLKEMPCNN